MSKKELGFGRVFTEHMVSARWQEGEGWGPHTLTLRGDVSMDPACATLHYAQALFDGLKAFRCDDGALRIFRLDAHIERMVTGAPRLAMPPVDRAALAEAVIALVRRDGAHAPEDGEGSLYIRPIVFAEEAYLGVRPSKVYRLLVLLSPVGSYGASGQRPLRLWVERHMVRAAPGGLGAVKAPANYAASLLAGLQAQERGCDQVLWLDAVRRREVEEVGTMNLFAQIDGTVVTPPLAGTILPGITRASVLSLLREAEVPVEERPLALEELWEAGQRGTLEGVFGTGTAATIAPVGELVTEDDVLHVPVGRDRAAWLLARLRAIQRSTSTPHPWMTLVPPAA